MAEGCWLEWVGGFLGARVGCHHCSVVGCCCSVAGGRSWLLLNGGSGWGWLCGSVCRLVVERSQQTTGA